MGILDAFIGLPTPPHDFDPPERCAVLVRHTRRGVCAFFTTPPCRRADRKAISCAGERLTARLGRSWGCDVTCVSSAILGLISKTMKATNMPCRFDEAEMHRRYRGSGVDTAIADVVGAIDSFEPGPSR